MDESENKGQKEPHSAVPPMSAKNKTFNINEATENAAIVKRLENPYYTGLYDATSEAEVS